MIISRMNFLSSPPGILLEVGNVRLPDEGGRASAVLHPKLSQLHHARLGVHHVQTADEMCKKMLNAH